jgi:hypothetical protein
MVLYIGKKVKINLDLYCIYVVWSSIRNGKKIVN